MDNKRISLLDAAHTLEDVYITIGEGGDSDSIRLVTSDLLETGKRILGKGGRSNPVLISYRTHEFLVRLAYFGLEDLPPNTQGYYIFLCPELTWGTWFLDNGKVSKVFILQTIRGGFFSIFNPNNNTFIS